MKSRYSFWMRLLALMLVFGMVAGCFVGCSDGSGKKDDSDDEKSNPLKKKRIPGRA